MSELDERRVEAAAKALMDTLGWLQSPENNRRAREVAHAVLAAGASSQDAAPAAKDRGEGAGLRHSSGVVASGGGDASPSDPFPASPPADAAPAPESAPVGFDPDERVAVKLCRDPLHAADAAPGLREAAETLAMRIGGIYRCPICDKNGYAHKESCPVLAVWHALKPEAAALGAPRSGTEGADGP